MVWLYYPGYVTIVNPWFWDKHKSILSFQGNICHNKVEKYLYCYILIKKKEIMTDVIILNFLWLFEIVSDKKERDEKGGDPLFKTP